MVGVSQNTYSLSMVTYTQFNQFWVRRGWNNKLMTIDEIQYRFERAATVRESAERELENVRKELSAYFTTEPMAWVAAVPLSRQVDHIPVDIAAMKQIVESSSYFAAFPKRADMKYLHPKAFLSVLRPTLRGIGSHPDWKNIGLLELRRDGTVVFAAGGERVQEVARYRRPLWMIYEPWYSGLYLLQDVQKSYSVSPMAIAQCGLLNWEESSLQPIGNRPDGWTRADLKVGDLNVPMYPKLLDEDWCPAEAFMDWAKQLANYLHQDKAISVRPWVTQ